jgi:ATP-dependent RNA helicase DDX52/ROK1
MCELFYSIAAVMRASGCDVPDYMLAMKKHSKKERRKLEHTAPTREKILTIPTYKRRKQKSRVNKESEAEEKNVQA